ncbi:hypothetical protein D3C71_1817550 [compost metagenome]
MTQRRGIGSTTVDHAFFAMIYHGGQGPFDSDTNGATTPVLLPHSRNRGDHHFSDHAPKRLFYTCGVAPLAVHNSPHVVD